MRLILAWVQAIFDNNWLMTNTHLIEAGIEKEVQHGDQDA